MYTIILKYVIYTTTLKLDSNERQPDSADVKKSNNDNHTE